MQLITGANLGLLSNEISTKKYTIQSYCKLKTKIKSTYEMQKYETILMKFFVSCKTFLVYAQGQGSNPKVTLWSRTYNNRCETRNFRRRESNPRKRAHYNSLKKKKLSNWVFQLRK